MQTKLSWPTIAPLFFLVLLLMMNTWACYEDDTVDRPPTREEQVNHGGRNENQERAGGSYHGSDPEQQVALSPDGRFVIGIDAQDQAWVIDLEQHKTTPLDLGDPTSLPEYRVAFGQGSLVAILKDFIQQRTLFIVDMKTGEVQHTLATSLNDKYLTVSDDGRYVACWGSYSSVILVDMLEGTKHEKEFDDYVWDVRYLAKAEKWVVLERHYMEKEDIKHFENDLPLISNVLTRATFLSKAKLKRAAQFLIPNCPAPLEISPDGRLGIVAPTRCDIWRNESYKIDWDYDFENGTRLSFIDLEAFGYRETITGLGPVSYAPSGDWALGYSDNDYLDIYQHHSYKLKYSLLFLDTAHRTSDVLDWGAIEPLYTITSDSRNILAYAPNEPGAGIWIVDAETKESRRVRGPVMELNRFVIDGDSANAYLLNNGIFELSIEDAKLDYRSIPCHDWLPDRLACNPDRINILPDGRLLLGFSGSLDLLIYDPVEEAIVEAFTRPEE